MSPLASLGRHDRFGIEILMSCANALCQNSRIRRSRILGQYAGLLLLPPLRPGFAKKTAFLSAKAQKLKNSAKQNSWIVCRFPLWNSARCSGALAWGLGLGWAFPVPKPTFGLQLLVGQGFISVKAGHSDQRFGCPVIPTKP